MGKRSRSRSAKRRKERSESRGKKNAKPAKGRSRSNKKKGRNVSRSPSRKRGREASPIKRGREAKPSAPVQQKRPSPKRVAPPATLKGVGKPGAKAASESPDRAQRASPSYDRGAGSRSASRSASKSPAPKQYEVVDVKLKERPFGMGPSKEDGVSGYVVAKVADGKPADEAGVKPGWQLISIAGSPCRDLDLEAIQVLLKAPELPVALEFERQKEEAPQSSPKGDDDSDEEMDVGAFRAEHRMNNQSGIDLLDELPVKRSPEDLPEPILDWQAAVDRKLLNKSLMEKLQTAGLKRPTLIQRHAVPIIGHKSGHYDMIASSQTGSGKTFAFVIPTVARLLVEGANGRPFFPGTMAQAQPLILVLSPTRELAMQTNKEIDVMTKGSNLIPLCIYGGESLKFQMQKLVDRQTDIICATPGRLIDIIDAGKISLSFVQSVILDEADQMMAQSLEIMCAEILVGRDMPPPDSRQTLLFSATMPQKIRDLVPKILRQEPGRTANLTVGHYNEDKGGACASIKQVLRWVPEEHQRAQAMVGDLNNLWISKGRKGRVVIFTNQRIQAGQLAQQLQNNGISCLHLHGKLDQCVREEVFDKFRKGQADVLVATNVASRGLDFPDISFVVQYNLPKDVDIYTHRIGRTGRVGQVGCSLSYVGPKDRHLFPKMVEFLELNKQEVPHFLLPREQDLRYAERGGKSPPRGGYGKGKGKGKSKGGGYGRSRSRDRRGGGGYGNDQWQQRSRY